ncbi:hypothetical protein ACOME3_009402 [Neoechinorhynchus agilis]
MIDPFDEEHLKDSCDPPPSDSTHDDVLTDEQKARKERQRYYNARERRRRHHLRQAFANLQEPLQNIKEKAPSRCTILRKAVQYIRALEERETELLRSIKTLTAENKEIIKNIEDAKDDDELSEDQWIQKFFS